MEEENKDVYIPQPLSEALFHPKITPKQRKFILLIVHSEGLKSASQCAIEAGYSKKSATELASTAKRVLLSWHPGCRTLSCILLLQKLLIQRSEQMLTGIGAHKKDRCLHWLE